MDDSSKGPEKKSKGNRGGYNNNYRGKWSGNSFNRNFSSSKIKETVKIVFYDETARYPGWNLYFSVEEFKDNSPTHQKIKAMECFIKENESLFKFDTILENLWFEIDIITINANENFIKMWENFSTDITDDPGHSLNCLGLAMHQSIYTNQKSSMDSDEILAPIEIPFIAVRLSNHKPTLHLKDLKVNYYGKLVTVRGTIIRCGPIGVHCSWIAYECELCKAVQSVKQVEGSSFTTAPPPCPDSKCHSKHTKPLLLHALTRGGDKQTVRIQETGGEGGRVPRTLDVELSDTLVGGCIPGDDVTVTGVVKVHNEGSRSANAYLLYLEAVSVVTSKEQTGGPVEFSVRDYYAIQKIHAEPELAKLLVHSLCPQIYGQEVVKLGLLLGLFGGGESRPETRSDIHVLVVGDPGLGKSQLLVACTNAAPRGVYVCGNTSTGSGLTVTLTREPGGDFALEAGALVLAHQGICCIDEFDKMGTHHQALLEAMEQQTVSIAKAGVVCSLGARCGVLAAANPAGGHYKRSKTVSENIRLSAALLSRFDLVFILLDQPDSRLDSLLSEHVLALHRQGTSEASSSNVSVTSNDACTQNQNRTLADRLRLCSGEAVDLLPHVLLRKYIAYARRYVRPRLGPEAVPVLQEFYAELRRSHQTADSTPVTARQLQALVRLTQARAKLELREEATRSDALEVIDLMRACLADTMSNTQGQLDMNRSIMGSGVSQRSKAKQLLSVLQRHARISGNDVISREDLLKRAAQAGIVSSEVHDVVSTLNMQGFLLSKGKGTYKLLSV